MDIYAKTQKAQRVLTAEALRRRTCPAQPDEDGSDFSFPPNLCPSIHESFVHLRKFLFWLRRSRAKFICGKFNSTFQFFSFFPGQPPFNLFQCPLLRARY
jgi:hypothetical protein